ncbi:MAG: PKD domain-containing protein [Gemmatimonadota bacterium]|nr:PKD domain-containing protein [Gemmatimonadota bacterium]
MNRVSPVHAFGALAALLTAAACLDSSITGTRPASLSIAADPLTVSVDEPVTITVSATGTGITGISLDFGDGSGTTLTYSGPIEVVDQATHTYDTPGGYTITGTLIAAQGDATAQVSVTVN